MAACADADCDECIQHQPGPVEARDTVKRGVRQSTGLFDIQVPPWVLQWKASRIVGGAEEKSAQVSNVGICDAITLGDGLDFRVVARGWGWSWGEHGVVDDVGWRWGEHGVVGRGQEVVVVKR